MFTPDEFLGPAEKMPLLFQATYLHVLKSTPSIGSFISIVKNSQDLMNSSCSMLWQIHRTNANSISMISSMKATFNSKEIPSTVPKEIIQWIEELVEEVNMVNKRSSMLDVNLDAEWKKVMDRKTLVMSSKPNIFDDFALNENLELATHLKSVSQYLGQAGAVLQEIIRFLDKVGSALKERKQEWRKILILLNSRDPGLQSNVKVAEENWDRLGSSCKEVKNQFEKLRINQLYNKILHEDPRDLPEEQCAIREADCIARVKQIEKLAYQ